MNCRDLPTGVLPAPDRRSPRSYCELASVLFAAATLPASILPISRAACCKSRDGRSQHPMASLTSRVSIGG